MLAEGMQAPTFTLPSTVDGAIEEVDLSTAVGEEILVLVFYPADFNPACEEESCDLTELDLFTMQRDVQVLAVSTDSVYSHRAFAGTYSLEMPLLSDTHGEVVEQYGVRHPDRDDLVAQRAVFVIDQEGTIKYTWATTDMTEHPDVDEVREAVSNIGGDSTAVGRYRVGHAHYIEGRRAFTSAMRSYEEQDWLISQGDFERAMAEFQEAADQFQSAVRFAESDPLEGGFERAQEKSIALWQAAEWLADSASAYASGNGDVADDYRQDAETPLETARDIGEPPDPDDIDLDAAGDAQQVEENQEAPDLEKPSDPATGADDTTPGGGDDRESEGEDVDAAVEAVEDEVETATESTTTDSEHVVDPEESEDVDLDVDEVAAEIEAENEAAAKRQARAEADEDDADGETERPTRVDGNGANAVDE